jgi:hypothetical protein
MKYMVGRSAGVSASILDLQNISFEGKKGMGSLFSPFQEWEACPFPSIPYRQSAIPQARLQAHLLGDSCCIVIVALGQDEVKQRVLSYEAAPVVLRCLTRS